MEINKFLFTCDLNNRKQIIFMWGLLEERNRDKVFILEFEYHVILYLYLFGVWHNSCNCTFQADIHDHLSQRRSSYNIEYGRGHRGVASGSASKVDLLKSALEISHKTSNPSVMSKAERTSNHSLNRFRADSAPKLNLNIPKALGISSAPVLEVRVAFCQYCSCKSLEQKRNIQRECHNDTFLWFQSFFFAAFVWFQLDENAKAFAKKKNSIWILK